MTERFDVLAPRREIARDGLPLMFVFDERDTDFSTRRSADIPDFGESLRNCRKEPTPTVIGHRGVSDE